jgi:hypothetical protein
MFAVNISNCQNPANPKTQMSRHPVNSRQREAESKAARKTISAGEKLKITQLRIPSVAEIQAAKSEAKQTATEAAVRAVMPQLEAMRREGMTFMKIQRIFTQGGVDISLTDLRVTFDRLRAEAGATSETIGLPGDTP